MSRICWFCWKPQIYLESGKYGGSGVFCNLFTWRDRCFRGESNLVSRTKVHFILQNVLHPWGAARVHLILLRGWGAQLFGAEWPTPKNRTHARRLFSSALRKSWILHQNPWVSQDRRESSTGMGSVFWTGSFWAENAKQLSSIQHGQGGVSRLRREVQPKTSTFPLGYKLPCRFHIPAH